MLWNIDWKLDNCYIWMIGYLYFYCLIFFLVLNKDKIIILVIEFLEVLCYEYMFDFIGK